MGDTVGLIVPPSTIWVLVVLAVHAICADGVLLRHVSSKLCDFMPLTVQESEFLRKVLNMGEYLDPELAEIPLSGVRVHSLFNFLLYFVVGYDDVFFGLDFLPPNRESGC